MDSFELEFQSLKNENGYGEDLCTTEEMDFEEDAPSQQAAQPGDLAGIIEASDDDAPLLPPTTTTPMMSDIDALLQDFENHGASSDSPGDGWEQKAARKNKEAGQAAGKSKAKVECQPARKAKPKQKAARKSEAKAATRPKPAAAKAAGNKRRVIRAKTEVPPMPFVE